MVASSIVDLSDVSSKVVLMHLIRLSDGDSFV